MMSPGPTHTVAQSPLDNDAELLEISLKVFDVATSLGRLPDNSPLPDLIEQGRAQLKTATDRQLHAATRIAIRLENARMIRNLAPITLLDIMNEWTPRRGFKPGILWAISTMVSFMFILVVVVWVSLSYSYAVQITDRVRQLDEYALSSQTLRIIDLWRSPGVDDLNRPVELRRELTSSLLDVMRDLGHFRDRYLSASEELFEFRGSLWGCLSQDSAQRSRNASIGAAFGLSAELEHFGRCLFGDRRLIVDDPLVRENLTADRYISPGRAIDPTRDPTRGQPSTGPHQAFSHQFCAQIRDEPDVGVGPRRWSAAALLVCDLSEIFAVLRFHALSPNNYIPLFQSAEPVRRSIEMFETILLPIVWGWFGVLVFYLRTAFNPLHPHPGGLLLVFRVASGGVLAFVLVMLWNLLPFQSAEPGRTSFSPILIGFLAGYSTEFVYRMLDRALAVVDSSADSQPAARRASP